MPKVSAPLTDQFVKNVKPSDKPKKYFDGGGLHLLVEVNGSKYWRMSYTFGGKFKTMAFGVYPDKTLSAARKDRERQGCCWRLIKTQCRSGKQRSNCLRLGLKTALRPWLVSGWINKLGWSGTKSGHGNHSTTIFFLPLANGQLPKSPRLKS
jgi:hypothetical protein